MSERTQKDYIIKRIKEEKENAEKYIGREFAIYLWIDKLTLNINWGNQPPRFLRDGEPIHMQTTFGTKTVSIAEILVHPLDYILNRLAKDFDINLW